MEESGSPKGEPQPTEGECTKVCRCVLSIESTRWKEELQPAQIEYRTALCRAKTWPRLFKQPLEHKIPGALTSPDEKQSKPSQHFDRWIVICTPRLTDTKGNFPPDIHKAMKDGSLLRHWDEVNNQIDILKNNKASRLFEALVLPNNTVMLITSGIHEKNKIKDIQGASKSARCPNWHLSYEYPLEEWVKTPGLHLKKQP